MKLHRCAVVALFGALLAPANGAQAGLYWISYEATGTYPEEEGWQRHAYGGGSQRSIEEGSLVLDAGGISGIIDNYSMPGFADPGPGEVFRMEWRLRVDEAEYTDPVVAVSSYGHGDVALDYTREAILSEFEGVWIPFAPDVYHDYVLTTSDMLSFQLAIDGEPVYAGEFVGPTGQTCVSWGDSFYAASSISRWDYFRFGIITEPSSTLLTISVCAVGFFLRAR